MRMVHPPSHQLPGLGSDIEAYAVGEAGPSGMGGHGGKSLGPVAPSRSLEERETPVLAPGRTQPTLHLDPLPSTPSVWPG